MIHPQLTRAKFMYTKSFWTEYLPNLDPEITEVPIRCDLWEQQLLHEPLNEKNNYFMSMEYWMEQQSMPNSDQFPEPNTCVSVFQHIFALPNLQ